MALELFISLVSTYCSTVDLLQESRRESRCAQIYDVVDNLFPRLADMAHAHSMASAKSGEDWGPGPLLQHHWNMVEDLKDWNFRGLNLATSWYLRKWHSQRWAKMLSNKVAGHCMPPELVEMV